MISTILTSRDEELERAFAAIGRLTCFEALVACAHLDTKVAAVADKSPMSEAIAKWVGSRPMTETVAEPKRG